MEKVYRAGIDIGSTTVKLAVLDANDNLIFGSYKRHNACTQETLKDLLKEFRESHGNCGLNIKITGSGAINLGKALDIDFVQEVAAVADALKKTAPQTDVAIELGGEDAKIIYFDGGLEERMNGVCAGGTGAFIDQMAALLETDAKGLNEAARSYKHIYPIAARCGVFAKTDIQPLINEGASVPDLAASVFQAVVNQTVSGLACGKPIRGNVAFLGGPLHFLTELKKAFIRTLGLNDGSVIDPPDSHLFAAVGAALQNGKTFATDELIGRLNKGVKIKMEMPRLEPLFANEAEYEEFTERHKKAIVLKGDIKDYQGNCFLGIDAGSTTTKMALIGEDCQLLWSYYANNKGNPIETAKTELAALLSVLPDQARIARACSTGYGESLLKAAFSLDDGEVETIAHCNAAAYFEPRTDCVLDIGGQDMKCIKLKSGAVDSIMLNEACSSGCGSFIESFANSLGYTAEEFSKEALRSKAPVDLGTRCTVFMNSNVKQAQKEGASVADISAGLAYSVIKNAIYKVIKLSSAADLGEHIVVQGGTFHNIAVLRAFEKTINADAVCPDIAGLMGAFGAALIAKSRYNGQMTSMLPLDKITDLQYKQGTARCKGCRNSCILTVTSFSDGKRHIIGNRCENGAGNAEAKVPASNMFEYKRKRIFAYKALPEDKAPRGVIGIPRVLNIYENYPFWATFFRELGFSVVLSPFSTRKIYEMGMESIPSESECYPAKLTHGHIMWLKQNGVKTVFHPCVYYEYKEVKDAQNCYNCPIVISYPENIKNNVEAVGNGEIRYIHPFLSFTSEKAAADRLVQICRNEWEIPEKETRVAAHKAWAEQRKAKADIRKEGKRILDRAGETGEKVIILAGRPYHSDPEINHGIPELIASYGFAVLTEDAIPLTASPNRPLRVVDQWAFHSRLYLAAEYAAKHENTELIQMTSFGCGLDAVTADEVSEILEGANKLYTLLKIDEVNNLGAVRIRVRSLIAAIRMRNERGVCLKAHSSAYIRARFTKDMKREGYTLLAPQMSPIHFSMLEPAFRKYGYNMVVLDNDNRRAIDTGLKYINNDACYPSVTMVGQYMDAILSGKYDTNKLAILMTQTGGCCRASNYVAFIRRALEKAGLSHIPVVSLNFNGMEKNAGFRLSYGLIRDAVRSIVFGDLFMRCLYRVRPYEKVKGSADALHEKWEKICIESLTHNTTEYTFEKVCRGIVRDFDELPIHEDMKKPRVGIVGEILVKYMPLANNHLVDLLEREGAEVTVPDMVDFFNYTAMGYQYKAEYLGFNKAVYPVSKAAIRLLETIRKPAKDALRSSKRFDPPISIYEIAEMTKPFLSLGNRYGEGWLLAGEMVELINSGVPNIVCIQPFACLPNHVVGKGVIKAIRKTYPCSNIAAVDYDPGASEVNQLNRIKLMLTTAQRNTDNEN